MNGRETDVDTHAEVGDGSDENNGCCHVVKEAVATLLAVRQADEGEARYAHGGADGEVEVGAMGGYGDICGGTIDSVV